MTGMGAVRAVNAVTGLGAATAPRLLPVPSNPDDFCDRCGAALIHTLEDPKGLRICPRWCHERPAA